MSKKFQIVGSLLHPEKLKGYKSQIETKEKSHLLFLVYGSLNKICENLNRLDYACLIGLNIYYKKIK